MKYACVGDKERAQECCEGELGGGRKVNHRI